MANHLTGFYMTTTLVVNELIMNMKARVLTMDIAKLYPWNGTFTFKILDTEFNSISKKLKNYVNH